MSQTGSELKVRRGVISLNGTAAVSIPAEFVKQVGGYDEVVNKEVEVTVDFEEEKQTIEFIG